MPSEKFISKISPSHKTTDILKVQNCLFMYHVEQNDALATSFPTFHSRAKRNYETRSEQKTCQIYLQQKQISIAMNLCIRDWNNFKKDFLQIPENECLYENESKSKTSWFKSILNVFFTNINFYMCTLYYFYFPSSRAAHLTPQFMVLLVLIFIVNRNFKLLN